MDNKMRKMTKASLDCKLTDHELKCYGQDLAQALAQRDEVETLLSAAKADAKGKIEALDVTIGIARDRINSGYENREVDVAIEFDFAAGVKTFCRTDTGEVIKTEPITNEERQEELLPA